MSYGVAVPIHSMPVGEHSGRTFFLFYDLFMHWRRDRLTAVAPYYGGDFDFAEAGIDLEAVVLEVGGLRIIGRYLPYGLEGWEPSILFDFEHPRLAALIEDSSSLSARVVAGGLDQSFVIDTTTPPCHDISVALCVRDENRWLPSYLEYWLEVLGVDHAYVYDNRTEDRQILASILDPYVERGQVTRIDWPFWWRNLHDQKQIGQPPQEGHTLARFGADRWIGFFDTDEFLLPPAGDLRAVLDEYDPGRIGAVAFKIRWCMYKGAKEHDQIADPLSELVHGRDDPVNEKWKLFVSPERVRFMRFHWIQEDQPTVHRPDIRYYHLCVRDFRFKECKTDEGLGSRAVPDSALARLWSDHRAQRPHRPCRRLETADEIISHVEWSFEEALHGRSKLSLEVLAQPGMIGLWIRHLYNNLCDREDARLLEIGAWRGASTVSFLHGNRVNATVIDNWSQFGNYSAECVERIDRYRGESNVEILEGDCWAIDPSWLGRYNLYLYDAGHHRKDQARALTHFTPYLDDVAIVVIDDWHWHGPRAGTEAGLAKIEHEVVWRQDIPCVDLEQGDLRRPQDGAGWWNGLSVLVLARPDRPLSSASERTAC